MARISVVWLMPANFAALDGGNVGLPRQIDMACDVPTEIRLFIVAPLTCAYRTFAVGCQT